MRMSTIIASGAGASSGSHRSDSSPGTDAHGDSFQQTPWPVISTRVSLSEDDHYCKRSRRRKALRCKCWEYFIQSLEWVENIQEPPRSGWLANIVHSPSFEHLSSLVIVANCVLTAYVADWSIQHVGEQTSGDVSKIQYGFMFFYVTELVLRLLVHGMYFFVNEDYRWNLFDFGLVVLSVGDDIVHRLSDTANAGFQYYFVRLFRIMKWVKIFRTLRVIKAFKELAVILESFKNCLAALFWSFVMMAFIFFVFAMILLQGMTNFIAEDGGAMTDDEVGLVLEYFGSLPVAMLSLYMSVTGGSDWGTLYHIAEKAGPLYAVLFLFFTFFFAFAVMNILTGVFVEKAVAAAAPDSEAQIIEQRRQDDIDTERLREICQEMDENGDGFISLEAFQRQMSLSKGHLWAHLAAIGLDIRDGHGFFEILSTLGCRKGGKVNLEKFVQRCMALRGSATTLDVQRQLFETMTVKAQVTALETNISQALRHLEEILMRQEGEVPCRRTSLCESVCTEADDACGVLPAVYEYGRSSMVYDCDIGVPIMSVSEDYSSPSCLLQAPAQRRMPVQPPGNIGHEAWKEVREQGLPQTRPTGDWSLPDFDPSSVQQDADVGVSEKRRSTFKEDLGWEARKSIEKEEKATQSELEWMLGKLREEFATVILPQVASSICTLVEPQLQSKMASQCCYSERSHPREMQVEPHAVGTWPSPEPEGRGACLQEIPETDELGRVPSTPRTESMGSVPATRQVDMMSDGVVDASHATASCGQELRPQPLLPMPSRRPSGPPSDDGPPPNTKVRNQLTFTPLDILRRRVQHAPGGKAPGWTIEV